MIKNPINQKIIKRNLIYVIGLTDETTDEDLLKKTQFFGQYGTVKKIIVNLQKAPKTRSFKRNIHSAYITYENELEAMYAILALGGKIINECEMKVSFGTTKYCTYFLNDKPCTNQECLYLHEYVPESDICSNKEEISQKLMEINREELIQTILKNQDFFNRSKDSYYKTDYSQIDTIFPSLQEALKEIMNRYWKDYEKQNPPPKTQQKSKDNKCLINSISKWDSDDSLDQKNSEISQDSQRKNSIDFSFIENEEKKDMFIKKCVSVQDTQHLENSSTQVSMNQGYYRKFSEVDNKITEIDCDLSLEEKMLLKAIKKMNVGNKKTHSRYSFVKPKSTEFDNSWFGISILVQAFNPEYNESKSKDENRFELFQQNYSFSLKEKIAQVNA